MTRFLAAVLAALAVLSTAPAVAAPPPFDGEVVRLPDPVRARMKGSSWRPGCPVALRDLRLVRMTYRRFDGDVRLGRLVVHEDVARDVLDAFEAMYDAGFRIRRMRLVDAYDADDDRSMAANNTSAFNCRYVSGTTRWSEHSYGGAVDINPVQNPWVRGDAVEPERGAHYRDRGDVRKGMIVEGDVVTRAFDAIGWGWGGRWSSSKDYQHFSSSGR